VCLCAYAPVFLIPTDVSLSLTHPFFSSVFFFFFSLFLHPSTRAVSPTDLIKDPLFAAAELQDILRSLNVFAGLIASSATPSVYIAFDGWLVPRVPTYNGIHFQVCA
jgi:hypothetical protein